MPHKLKISLMRKKLYLFPLFLLGFFMFATTACLNNDKNEVEIDEEWKTLNETRFAKTASDNSFDGLSSQSGNGKVYWQTSTVITDTDAGKENTVRITVEGKPEFTDTVIIRYEGWFFDKNGEKVIFDSTENPSLRSKIAYSYGAASSPDPNYNKVTFAINPTTSGTASNNYVGGIIEGCSILLQDMFTGDERVVCIPHELGYGGTASSYSPTSSSPSFTLIPAYTTIWFRIKLYEIIPMKGLK